MTIIRRTGTLAVLLSLAILPLLAHQAPAPGGLDRPAQPPAVQGQAAAPIRGELIEVDTEAKTLTVMTASDTKEVFTYTDETEVVGAQKGIEGLATMDAAQVSVQFTEADKVKTATRIEVQPGQP